MSGKFKIIQSIVGKDWVAPPFSIGWWVYFWLMPNKKRVFLGRIRHMRWKTLSGDCNLRLAHGSECPFCLGQLVKRSNENAAEVWFQRQIPSETKNIQRNKNSSFFVGGAEINTFIPREIRMFWFLFRPSERKRMTFCLCVDPPQR